jgi:hypothetical protein
VAIVMRENRPVVLVRGDSYDDFSDPWRGLNSVEVKTRLSALFPLVGRIELPNSTVVPYAGACFVVGKGLVATKRHIAQEFSRGLGLAIQYRGGDAAIDFKRQIDTPEDDPSAYFAVSGVEMIHPYWEHGPTAGGRIAGRQDASLVGAPRRSSSSIAISWWSATRRSILETTRHSRIRS